MSGEVLRVTEMLVDPKWRVFPIQIGGAQMIILRLEHPRHGNVDCQLEVESAEGLRGALKNVLSALEGLPPTSVRMQ